MMAIVGTMALGCVTGASLLGASVFSASSSRAERHTRSLFAWNNDLLICNIFGCIGNEDQRGPQRDNEDGTYLNTFDTSRFGGATLTVGTTNGAITASKEINPEDVADGFAGCVFHLDAKEMYRFILDSQDVVQGWSSLEGQRIELHSSQNKHPLYLESSFQGMHSLGLYGDRQMTLIFPESSSLDVFVVYSPGASYSELLVKDSASSIALMAHSGSSHAVAVGTSTGLNKIGELIVGTDFGGKVAEVLVFNRVLSYGERQAIYDRLVIKWIARKPRELPNMFTLYPLGLSDSDVKDAVRSVALNLQRGYFETADNFRGSGLIFNRDTDTDGRVYSHFHPEWLAALFYAEDKAKFDSAIDLLETWHLRSDGASRKRYFYAKVGEDSKQDAYFTTYSGQGNHGYLGEVLYRAYAKYRDPRYLNLANEIVNFWYSHTAWGNVTNGKTYFYREDDMTQGSGEGIVKMFKNDVLDSKSYTECTYQSPTTARMATEFGASGVWNETFLDLVPNAQNRWFLRGAHPVTGLIPSTSKLDGTPVGHRDERWMRFANDATEKAFDRFINVMLNYEQDHDAGIAESLLKVASWANGIGVDSLKSDYELDGFRDQSPKYKHNDAPLGMKASLASLSTIVHDEVDMKDWVQDVWKNKANRHRSLRGYARAFFTLSGAVQIPNDAPRLDLVSNGGFEARLATTGWSRHSQPSRTQCTATSEASRRGSRGLSCLGHSLYPLLDLSMLNAGATYSYYAWVRSPEGIAKYHVRYDAVVDGSVFTKETSFMIGNTWEKVGVSFTIPAGSVASLQVEVVGDSLSESFHFDDAHMFLKHTPLKDGDVQLMGGSARNN